MKIVQTLCRGGSGGRDCEMNVFKMCEAFDPHLLHTFIAQSRPQSPSTQFLCSFSRSFLESLKVGPPGRKADFEDFPLRIRPKSCPEDPCPAGFQSDKFFSSRSSESIGALNRSGWGAMAMHTDSTPMGRGRRDHCLRGFQFDARVESDRCLTKAVITQGRRWARNPGVLLTWEPLGCLL